MALKFSGASSAVNELWTGVPIERYTTPAQINSKNTPNFTPIVQTENMTLIPGQSAPEYQMSLANDSDSKFRKWLSDNQLVEPKMTTIPQAQAKVAAMTASQTAELPSVSDNTAALLNAINTSTQNVTDIENARLKKAAQQNLISGVAQIASTIMGGQALHDYTKAVKDTKSQYETQKKILDTNIANSETLMMENYREAMADLDVMSASQNVDLTSGALQGMKDKGAMDMGRDFSIARTNADLQKKALDLQYAMNVKSAARQEKNYWQQSTVNSAFTLASLI